MAADTTPHPVATTADVTRQGRAELLAAVAKLHRALAVSFQDASWITQVEAGISRLAGAFNHHVLATEGTNGMYAEIVRNAPRLKFAVGQLVIEHDKTRSDFGALAYHLTTADPADHRAIEQVRADGTGLLSRLARHRQRGEDIMFEACEQDIGACD